MFHEAQEGHAGGPAKCETRGQAWGGCEGLLFGSGDTFSDLTLGVHLLSGTTWFLDARSLERRA